MAISVRSFPKKRAVNYRQFRKEIRSGDLLLCSGSAWFSKMIQKTTESAWSHVGFVMRLDSIDQPGVFVPVTMLATPVQATLDEAVESVVQEVFVQGYYGV